MRETRLLRILSALLLAACCSLPALAQTTTAVNLEFLCTPPTERTDTPPTPITAADGLTIRVYEVSLAGVRGAAPVVSGPTCPLRLTAVTGTKRYVMTAIDKNGIESDATTPAMLVTTYKPKTPGSAQVRAVFTTSP